MAICACFLFVSLPGQLGSLCNSLDVLQAFGGLLVAFACKYANNIMKNFACTLSIVLSTLILSISFPEHSPLSGQFLLGASLVMAATYLYGKEDAAAKEASTAAADTATKGAYTAVPAREPKDIDV